MEQMPAKNQSPCPGTGAGFLMPISDEEFELLRRLIYQRFGINLSEQKRSLLVGRLQKLLRKERFGTFRDYYDHLTGGRSEAALSQLVDHISTNHTFFNRESAHFEFFQKKALPEVVAELKKANRRDLRVWCAGCSSGEEAYMLLMLMQDFFAGDYQRWDAGILASDISERVLAVARAGVYPEEKVASLPEGLRRKYLQGAGNGCVRIREQLRKEATFRRFNLMNSFPFKRPFQIIFCRNVMIYFDQATRDSLVRKFHQFLEPGGYLFVGHSESLGRSQNLLRYVMPAVYRKDQR